MFRHSYNFLLLTVLWGVVCFASLQANAQTIEAAYFFQGTLDSSIANVPALTAVDPLGQNRFEMATVFGQSRQVYHCDGNASPDVQQAGLSLDTSGLVRSNNYSMEILFEFTERQGGWRRILDVQNRTSDNGLYINASNRMTLYPVGGSSTIWSNNTFHHVVLTNADSNVVKGYLDGRLQFSLATDIMHINNPQNLINLFLDQTSGTNDHTEFSDSRIAATLLFDGVLSDSQVLYRFNHPFTTAVPAPGALVTALMGAVPGICVLLHRARRPRYYLGSGTLLPPETTVSKEYQT